MTSVKIKVYSKCLTRAAPIQSPSSLEVSL